MKKITFTLNRVAINFRYPFPKQLIEQNLMVLSTLDNLQQESFLKESCEYGKKKLICILTPKKISTYPISGISGTYIYVYFGPYKYCTVLLFVILNNCGHVLYISSN